MYPPEQYDFVTGMTDWKGGKMVEVGLGVGGLDPWSLSFNCIQAISWDLLLVNPAIFCIKGRRAPVPETHKNNPTKLQA